jgi:Lrp/AsnC family transcriptional regulator, leucine-responsive regulatory protein
MSGMRTLDGIDRQIVALMSGHGRISHEEIARRVHISRSAVHERVKRLERDGVIRGYRAVVDWTSIDLGLCGFVSVQVEHECMPAVLGRLLEFRATDAMVEECHRVTGEWCALLKVRAATPQSLLGLLDAIQRLNGVQQLMTAVVLSSLEPAALN